MPIVKHKVPSADQLNAKQEFEALNANIELLSDAVDKIAASVAEIESKINRPDERLSSLAIKVGNVEKVIQEMKASQPKMPTSLILTVTGRNDITGQIDEAHIQVD
jgi:septal ring factor EnvC (AmiA/AmiB activator)